MVVDTPGIMVPRFERDNEGFHHALKLGLTGAIKDSLVGEDFLPMYLLHVLNVTGNARAYLKLLRPAGLTEATDDTQQLLMATARLLREGKITGVQQLPAKAMLPTAPTNTDATGAGVTRFQRGRDAQNVRYDDTASAVAATKSATPPLRNAAATATGSGVDGMTLSAAESARAARWLVAQYRQGALGRFTLDHVPVLQLTREQQEQFIAPSTQSSSPSTKPTTISSSSIEMKGKNSQTVSQQQTLSADDEDIKTRKPKIVAMPSAKRMAAAAASAASIDHPSSDTEAASSPSSPSPSSQRPSPSTRARRGANLFRR
jgi:hypothetical protein